jgi:hypothetical protein
MILILQQPTSVPTSIPKASSASGSLPKSSSLPAAASWYDYIFCGLLKYIACILDFCIHVILKKINSGI